jgi:hypothetical protein
MPLPEPKPGLVIRYDYLWSDKAAAGHASDKDRPACLVAASDASIAPRFVVILPITHTAPRGGTVGVDMPSKVRRALGLDDAPSWVIVSEYNIDEWPKGGLSPLPGTRGQFSYGFIPPGLFARIKVAFLDLSAAGRSRAVPR